MKTFDRMLLGVIATALCVVAFRVDVASRAVEPRLEYLKAESIAVDVARQVDERAARGEPIDNTIAFLESKVSELATTDPRAAALVDENLKLQTQIRSSLAAARR